MSLPYDHDKKNFTPEKNQSVFGGREFLGLLKSVAAWFFVVCIMTRDKKKKMVFLIFSEKYRMSFMHCQPDKKLRH